MRLDLYTHHFSVTELTPTQQGIVLEFIIPLVQKGLIKKRGRFRQVPLKTYAARKQNRTEFRFHINQYDQFLFLLTTKGYMENDYTVHDHRDTLPKAARVRFQVNKLPKPYDYQTEIINYVLEPGISKMVTLQTGRGKALRNSTEVLTASGKKLISQLRVGDLVFAANGNLTKVTGVYPQPVPVDMYRVEFEDGRVKHACKDHQWVTIDQEMSNVFTTQQLVDMGGKHYIPLNVSVKRSMTHSPMLPTWLMGLLLKNGMVHKKVVNVVIIPRMVDEVFELAAKANLKFTKVHDMVNVYTLTDLDGKYPKTVVDRFLIDSEGGVEIPKYYDELSESDRMDFIRYHTARDYIFTISPDRFVYQSFTDANLLKFQRIIWSLGGIAKIVNKTVEYRLQRCHSRIWDGIELDDSLEYATKLGITSITYVGKEDATCIEVDDPSELYVLGDYIVTHNTMIAMTCAKQLGVRTIVIVKGGFAPKWEGDLKEGFQFEEGELLMVKGSSGLKKLLKDAKHRRPKMNPSVIVVTTRTLANYFKLYEQSNGTDKELVVPPHEILPTLKVGFRIMDEVHLEFHFVYRMDLYSHVMKSLSLSATLVSRDPFITQMHDIAYPKVTRNDGGGYIAYIDSTCMFYRLDKPDTVKCMGAQGYSHNEYEMWILESKERTKNYLRLIRKMVTDYYINIHLEGQSYLIFASSVDMCNAIKEDLEKHFGTYEIGRYCGSQGDDYIEGFLDPDIVVSTLGSAGAAVDKPGLLGSLLTVAVDSIQSVLQMMGRTRQLKGVKDMNPNLVYFTCRDIPKHMEYHKNKIDLFKGRVLTHALKDSNITV